MIINRDCSVEGAFARIPGFRIKRGMTERVFLDSASHRVTPHPMRGPFAGISGYRVVARYDVVHRIKCGMT